MDGKTLNIKYRTGQPQHPLCVHYSMDFRGIKRLPLLGGVFAPNQGMFPKYDSGLFEKENTKMIVSRGIGNSIIPLRFNNRPEMILVELRAAG